MGDNIIEVKFRSEREAESEMVEAVKATAYSFSGRMSIASALGVLSIVRHDLERELLDNS